MDNTSATLARFDAAQDRIVRDFGYGDTQGALGVTKDCLEPLKVFIEDRINDIPNMAEGSKEKDALRTVRHLSSDILAYATLGAALGMVAGDSLELATSQAIGSAIHGECWAAGLLEHDKELAAKIDRSVRMRHGNLQYRKQAARSIAARAGFRAVQWSKGDQIAIGRQFLGYLVDALPDVFLLEVGAVPPGKRWPSKRLGITEAGLAVAGALRRSGAAA